MHAYKGKGQGRWKSKWCALEVEETGEEEKSLLMEGNNVQKPNRTEQNSIACNVRTTLPSQPNITAVYKRKKQINDEIEWISHRQ